MSPLPIPQALRACSSTQERLEFLENLLADTVSTYLHLDSGQAVPRDRPLVEMGLTSLGATEFQRQLEKILAIRLDSSTVFSHPSILALRDYLAAEKLQDIFARATPAGHAHSAAGARAGLAAAAELETADIKTDDVEADYVQALLSKRFGI